MTTTTTFFVRRPEKKLLVEGRAHERDDDGRGEERDARQFEVPELLARCPAEDSVARTPQNAQAQAPQQPAGEAAAGDEMVGESATLRVERPEEEEELDGDVDVLGRTEGRVHEAELNHHEPDDERDRDERHGERRWPPPSPLWLSSCGSIGRRPRAPNGLSAVARASRLWQIRAARTRGRRSRT